jgi:cell wall assembly regulator SMI1
MNAEQRIENLEAALGVSLPAAYRAFLRSHREEPSRPVQVVSTNPDYWDVSSIFEIGDAESYLQVDNCHALVGDVLPDGMLPVAEDQGGNLYLLDCRTGPSTGAVYWWDHEQELGEDRVELVATSFPEFLAVLVPDS